MSHDQAKLERRLAHRRILSLSKHAEQVERELAKAISAADPKCKCPACQFLRAMRDELEG